MYKAVEKLRKMMLPNCMLGHIDAKRASVHLRDETNKSPIWAWSFHRIEHNRTIKLSSSTTDNDITFWGRCRT